MARISSPPPLRSRSFAVRRAPLLLLLAAAALLVPTRAAAQRGSGHTSTQTAKRPMSRTLAPQQAAMQASSCALTERHTASTGPQAPQIGLDPDWPQKYYDCWDEVKELYPDAAKPYESCVQMFREANDIIKQISPLTRRPLWDTHGDEIRAATRRASNLVKQGDRCLQEATNAVNANMPQRPVYKAGVSKEERVPPERPPRTGSVSEEEPPSGGGVPVPIPIPGPGPGSTPSRPRPTGGASGGYDPCANPVPAPGCPGTTPPNNGGASGGAPNRPPINAGTAKTDCLPAPDAQTQQQLRLDANEALRTLAACGQQCDIMLTTMGKLTAARLVQMTQPNEGIVSRTARTAPGAVDTAIKSTVTYMANDNARFHQMLLRDAQNAIGAANRMLQQQMRNPAATLGTVADSWLWGKATTGAVGACEATAVRVDALRKQVDEARKAAQMAKEIEDRAKQFAGNSPAPRCEAGSGPAGGGTAAGGKAPGRGYGTNGGSSGAGNGGGGVNGAPQGNGNRPPTDPVPGTGPAAAGGPNAVNPFNSDTNCVPVAVAAAKREATGRPYTAIDVTLEEGVSGYGPTFKLLRENFGDRTFPELPSYQQKLQAAGVPRPMDRGGIEAELRAAAQRGVQKPQGIVFIDRPNQTGHAFNAVWENGGVVYKDYQSGFLGSGAAGGMDASFHFSGASDVAFYRVQ